MTLQAVKPGGWSLNEILRSSQVTALQQLILRAIDGVEGGTYSLADELVFDAGASLVLKGGAGLRVEGGSVLEINGTGPGSGELLVAAGGTLTVASSAVVQAGATLTVQASGAQALAGQLTASGSGRILMQTGTEIQLDAGSTLDINTTMDLAGSASFQMHGVIDVLSGGSVEVASGGIIDINSGGRLDLNLGSELNVEGSAQINVEGSIEVGATGNVNVQSGGNVNLLGGADLIVQSGGHILAQNGATVQVEDANDLVVNGSSENWRLALVPAFIAQTTGGEDRWKSVSLGTWRQQDATTGGYPIGFALPLPPGDVVHSVNAFLNGAAGAGHSGALPGVLPSIEVVKLSVTGTFTTVAKTVDTAPAGTGSGGYDTVHFVSLVTGTVTVGAMPFTMTSDPHYVIVRGEQGGVDNTLELVSIFGQADVHSFRGTSGAMVYS